MSYPLRVRGLKQFVQRVVTTNYLSYPLRVRGLKHEEDTQVNNEHLVVSFTGTWIETFFLHAKCMTA